MTGVVVSDASPLIAFHQLDRLDILASIFGRLHVPDVVAEEVAPSIPTLPGWILITRAAGPPPASLVEDRTLHRGEVAAIHLGLMLQAEWLLADDLPARRKAEAMSLKVIGTLGILLAAKRRGMVHHVRPHIDRLLEHDFRVSSQLVEAVFREAGESDDR